MKEWLKAESAEDVGDFYDPKYRYNGYDAFSNKDRRDVMAVLEKHGGKFSYEKKLLDAGCGHGEFLAQVYLSVMSYGYDISSAAIALAKARHIDAEFNNADMMRIPEKLDGTFDYVTCLGSMEHTMDVVQTFHRLMRLLKLGGVFLVTLPLQFHNCLSCIEAEENQKTNERFADWEEWVALFGPQQPIEWFRVGDSDSKDIWMIYRKEK